MKKCVVSRVYMLVLMLLLYLLTGCATDIDQYANRPAQNIYHVGKNYLQKGNYSAAITAYESLSTQYPFGQYSQKADLDIIYAYFGDGDSAMALAAANSYIKLYPKSAHLDYALYMRGVLNFNAGRGFIQKYFPYDMQAHDPMSYELAFNDFKQLLIRYPQSSYSLDARRRMIYLNNMIAGHQLMIARYYFKKAAYVAAIHRAMNVLLSYSQTPVVKGALSILINSYQALGLGDYARAYEKIYQYNFPTVLASKKSTQHLAKNKA